MGINNNKACIHSHRANPFPRRGRKHLVRVSEKTSALRPPPREIPLKRNHNRKQIKVNAVENARRFGCRGRTGEIQKGIAASNGLLFYWCSARFYGSSRIWDARCLNHSEREGCIACISAKCRSISYLTPQLAFRCISPVKLKQMSLKHSLRRSVVSRRHDECKFVKMHFRHHQNRILRVHVLH